MSTNFQLEFERSFLHKIGAYLQQNSRDMSAPLNRSDGIVDFTFNNVRYGVVVKSPAEDLFYPGVNILFLDEADVATGRSSSTKKRYLVPIKLIITKPIEGNTRPSVVKAEVLGVQKLVLEALSDGHVEIWDYSAAPVYTGVDGWYHSIPYVFSDESLAIEGGDIRRCLTCFVNYLDPTL